MNGVIKGGIDTGWWSAHCCAGKLLPKSITKLEYIPVHDQFKPGDNGIGRESSGQFVGAEECSDCLQGMIRVYVCVHRHGIKHEKLGMQWKLWQSVKALFQLKRAGDE
jgi:hypothetical protein